MTRQLYVGKFIAFTETTGSYPSVIHPARTSAANPLEEIRVLTQTPW